MAQAEAFDHGGLLSRAFRRLLIALYRRGGWRAVNNVGDVKKGVIIAFPHTSNWDFVNFLGLTHDVGIKPHFMGKKSLFRWPFTRFMYDMGGVPVDRSASHNVVEQMVAQFNARERLLLTIAPEGTRDARPHWKTGFYQIAVAAKVPLILGYMDYARREGGLLDMLMPTGDYAADLAWIVERYRGMIPRWPDKTMLPTVAEQAGADAAR